MEPTYRSHSYNTTDALDLTISSQTYFHIAHGKLLTMLELQKNPITENLENEWFVFKHSIFTAAEGAVPRGKHKKTRPAFTNDSQDLQKLLAKREHLLQSHNLNDNTDARIELNKINAEIKREYCSIKQSNWQDLCKSLDYKTPNTRLWRLAKNLTKYNHRWKIQILSLVSMELPLSISSESNDTNLIEKGGRGRNSASQGGRKAHPLDNFVFRIVLRSVQVGGGMPAHSAPRLEASTKHFA
ncbi:putative RNA-directed DNA polymerase from transposon BS [Caerostris darwini]|uniref:RNA-directed DNA polymerase from transposon BS n=1 Tax=Caerostris darwini TaxID=1538125 RepID=A0AAV4PE95_9ARAC|nr:putative RNA-directed DNA polymerase from transposon BS [Caerostris darwini]